MAKADRQEEEDLEAQEALHPLARLLRPADCPPVPLVAQLPSHPTRSRPRLDALSLALGKHGKRQRHADTPRRPPDAHCTPTNVSLVASHVPGPRLEEWSAPPSHARRQTRSCAQPRRAPARAPPLAGRAGGLLARPVARAQAGNPLTAAPKGSRLRPHLARAQAAMIRTATTIEGTSCWKSYRATSSCEAT